MAYEKQTWVDNSSKLNAERLNHMEDGIKNADSYSIKMVKELMQLSKDKVDSGVNFNSITSSELTLGLSAGKHTVNVKGIKVFSILGESPNQNTNELTGEVDRYLCFREDRETWLLSSPAGGAPGYLKASVSEGDTMFSIIKIGGVIPDDITGYFTMNSYSTGYPSLDKHVHGTYLILKNKMNSSEEGNASVRVQYSTDTPISFDRFIVVNATQSGLEDMSAEDFYNNYHSYFDTLFDGGMFGTKATVTIKRGNYSIKSIRYDYEKTDFDIRESFTAPATDTYTIQSAADTDYQNISFGLNSEDFSRTFIFKNEFLNNLISEIPYKANNEVDYKPIYTDTFAINDSINKEINFLLKKNKYQSITGVQNGNSQALSSSVPYLYIVNATKDLSAISDRTQAWNGIPISWNTVNKYLVIVKTDSASPITPGSNTFLTSRSDGVDQFVNLTDNTKYFSNGYVLFTQKFNRAYTNIIMLFKWGESNVNVTGFGVLDLTAMGLDQMSAQEVFEFFGESGIQSLIEGNGPTTKVNLKATYASNTYTIGTYDSSVDGAEKLIKYIIPNNSVTFSIETVSGYATIGFSEQYNLTGSYLYFTGSLARKVADDSLRIDKLEENSIVTRNKDRKHIVEAASLYGVGYMPYTTEWRDKQFTFLVMTDIHGDIVREKSVVVYANYVKAIDVAVSLGDVSHSMFQSGATDALNYTAITSQCEKPFLPCIGNHDAGITTSVNQAGTKAQQFAQWIQPNLAKAGLPSNYTKTYYKQRYTKRDENDNIVYDIHFFMLDAFDAPDTLQEGSSENFKVARDTPCFSQAQIDWFISELANVPDSGTVVVCMHYLAVSTIRVENPFTCKRYGAYNITGYPIVYPDLIPDIINAWKNKTTLTKTYEPDPTSGEGGGPYWKGGLITDCPTINVSCDFSSRNESHFACYVGGHMHTDYVARIATYPDQLTLLLTTSCCDENRCQQNDIPRIFNDEESVTQDAITTVTIDVIKETVKLVRIGSNKTYDMIDRTCVEIPFEEPLESNED